MTTQEIHNIIKEKYKEYYKYDDDGIRIQFIDLCMTEEEKILNKLSGNNNYGLYNSVKIDIIKNPEIKIILRIDIKLNNKSNIDIWHSNFSFVKIDNDKINKMFDIIDIFSDTVYNFTMKTEEINKIVNNKQINELFNTIENFNNIKIQKQTKSSELQNQYTILNKNNIAYFIDNLIEYLAQNKINCKDTMQIFIIVYIKQNLYQYLSNNEKFVNGIKATSMPV